MITNLQTYHIWLRCTRLIYHIVFLLILIIIPNKSILFNIFLNFTNSSFIKVTLLPILSSCSDQPLNHIRVSFVKKKIIKRRVLTSPLSLKINTRYFALPTALLYSSNKELISFLTETISFVL